MTLMMLAVILDLFLGDPVYRYHPVRLIGTCLSFFETQLRRRGMDGQGSGFLLFVLLTLSILAGIEGIFWLLSQWHWLLGWGWHLYIIYSLLALKDLHVHGQRVADAAKQQDLQQARKQAGMMVGRDSKDLDLAGCNRAAIESISENLADGVIGPLFYLILFGVPGMIVFKIVSTMDSMVGYRNSEYIHFGWFGARLDDWLNWIPARLTWLLISGSAFLLPAYSGMKAFHTGWSQHCLLPSPNAGWSQAAAAGALQLKLVGPIWREGKLAHEHWMGDSRDREGANPDDIAKMSRIANLSTFLFISLILLLNLIFF
ncbi:MAG: cobalamin biosynthesis protein CobD [SAR324 cluster bacterium]|nr:cobalamin biosynthesis protein CobD [SAR324 cluster bacterium]